MKSSDKPANISAKDLILSAKKGNQVAFEQLLEQYKPLLSSQVKALCYEEKLSAQDFEDLFQEAVILFFRALNAFDTEQQKVSFGLYAKICIENGLKTQRKKMKNRAPVFSLENEAESVQTVFDPASSLLEEENYRLLYEKIRTILSPYENKIWWYYLSGRTAKDIASELKKDKKSVQNAIFRIRKKLRSIVPRH